MSHIVNILAAHDQNCSVGRSDLHVPVCNVPCLMCLCLAQRTAACSYILLCIIFITLTANEKAWFCSQPYMDTLCGFTEEGSIIYGL